jgi:AcrR family transcriptional regulator
MPKVDQKHLDARRKQILDAASRCFARIGFHMTTMQDVIRESALSAGAIYNYFAGKNDIVLAIAHERHIREDELLAKAAEKPASDMILEHLAADFFKTLLDRKRVDERRVSVQLWAEALHNDEIRASVLEGIEKPRRLIAGLVTEMKARGELPKDVSADAMARVVIALFQGFVLQACWDEKVDVAAYMRAVDVIRQRLTLAKPPVRRARRP